MAACFTHTTPVQDVTGLTRGALALFDAARFAFAVYQITISKPGTRHLPAIRSVNALVVVTDLAVGT